MTDVMDSCFLTFLFIFLFVFISADQKSITAESGQNVTLPCRAPNNNITVVEWSRADLGNEYVLLYQDRYFHPDNQHESFKNRVDLQDRQMKDGDVSLILKNVTTADNGTYECRVFQRGPNRRKRANLDGDPISIIQLSVVPPGQNGGDGDKDGGKKDGSVGLIVGLSVSALIVVVGFMIYKNHKTLRSGFRTASKTEDNY